MSDQDHLKVYASRLRVDLDNHNPHGDGVSNLSLHVGRFDLTKHHTVVLANFLPYDPLDPILDGLLEGAFGRLGRPWSEIGQHHVRVILGLRGNEPISIADSTLAQLKVGDALKSQTKIVEVLIKWLLRSAQRGSWAVPLLGTVCRDLLAVAIVADRVQAKGGREPNSRAAASKLLFECLQDCLDDKTADMAKSVKMAVYQITNLLLKTNQQDPAAASDSKWASDPLIARVDREQDEGRLPSFGIYPKADQTEYLYRSGRASSQGVEWQAAEVQLEESLRLCHYRTNVETILSNLVPLMLLRGIIPSETGFARKDYSSVRSVYDDRFLAAFTKGDIAAFARWANDREERLGSFGASSPMRTAQLVVFRNLVKRAWILEGKPVEISYATIALYISACYEQPGSCDETGAVRMLEYLEGKGWVNGVLLIDRVRFHLPNPFPWFDPLRPVYEGSAAARVREAEEKAEYEKVAPEELLARVGSM